MNCRGKTVRRLRSPTVTGHVSWYSTFNTCLGPLSSKTCEYSVCPHPLPRHGGRETERERQREQGSMQWATDDEWTTVYCMYKWIPLITSEDTNVARRQLSLPSYEKRGNGDTSHHSPSVTPFTHIPQHTEKFANKLQTKTLYNSSSRESSLE